MYTTCIFCNSGLGRNEAVEEFPVGRRLAFDPRRGRLWVVCLRCGRWNLSPIEERWEALETCERRFRATRLRTSTENIGLARMADGTDLVRIGEPERPEMAAWRYGRVFAHRFRRHMVFAGAVTAAAATAFFLGPVAGLVSGGGLLQLPNFANMARLARDARRVVLRLAGEEGEVKVRGAEASRARLVPEAAGQWRLEVRSRNRRAARLDSHVLAGPEAVAAAGKLLAHVNREGARNRHVREAVRQIEHAGHPERYFARAAALLQEQPASWKRGPGELGGAAPVVRLALEMAAHEESERRALEGELAALEAAWREAEEFAAIADDLLLPEGVRAFLARARG